MGLPGYDKENRSKSFEVLPKGAYVVKIRRARLDQNSNGNGQHITIAFDIAEGEKKDFYQKVFDANTKEDKKWPNDGIFYLNVPTDSSPDFIKKNWDSFFADLEDSNDGFVFDAAKADMDTLKGKLIGGKFANEQSEYNGKVYDHMKMRWTCTAQAVRDGKAGKLPNDKLIQTTPSSSNGFMNIDTSVDDDEIPFA